MAGQDPTWVGCGSDSANPARANLRSSPAGRISAADCGGIDGEHDAGTEAVEAELLFLVSQPAQAGCQVFHGCESMARVEGPVPGDVPERDERQALVALLPGGQHRGVEESAPEPLVGVFGVHGELLEVSLPIDFLETREADRRIASDQHEERRRKGLDVARGRQWTDAAGSEQSVRGRFDGRLDLMCKDYR